MWIARCDRFERDLGRRRGTSEDAGLRVSRELIEIAAVANDDRGSSQTTKAMEEVGAGAVDDCPSWRR
jgi:hypothetical protein